MSSNSGPAALVAVERFDGFARVTLDDPGRRNALSLDMSDALVAAFAALESTPDMRAVVVTGGSP